MKYISSLIFDDTKTRSADEFDRVNDRLMAPVSMRDQWEILVVSGASKSMYISAFGSSLSVSRASDEWIIWTVCLLIMATIRGIPNPVSSLSAIEVTTRPAIAKDGPHKGKR